MKILVGSFWRFFLLGSLVMMAASRVIAAEEDEQRREATRLAEESISEHHRADDLTEGWSAVYDHGIQLAEKAIVTDPTYADAYYALFVNLGRKSQRLGLAAQMRTFGRMRALLKKTLELDPRHAHAWEATGEMLLQLPRIMGGSEQAGEQALRRSAELDSQWPKPALRLAELHWEKGRAAEARFEAERARDLARAAGDADYLREAEGLLQEIGKAGR